MMQKILTSEQIRAADRATMDQEPIASIDLMERAASGCVDWFVEKFDSNKPVVVFAGIGNNGGDALVMARKLIDEGFKVTTYVIQYAEQFSNDLEVNLDRLQSRGDEVRILNHESQLPLVPNDSIVIDGIFGSGLNRIAESFAALCIDHINKCTAIVVSIDLPSGLFADSHTPESAKVINASYTLTFQVPKLAFLVSENQRKVGKWCVLDIGLDEKHLSTVVTKDFFVSNVQEYGSFFRRNTFSHKGNFGHALIIAGSLGKMGAAVLASRGAMRGGLGKLTVHVPQCGYDIMQNSVPEAMCTVGDFENFIGDLPDTSQFEVIACGPGLGTHQESHGVVEQLLGSCSVPLILDADALNIIAKHSDWLAKLPSHSILTPHVGEFDRLFGKSANSFERLALLKKMARKYKVIIVLKGAYSVIASSDGNLYFNSTGNPGMATAGSGDVLTGVIAACVGQVNGVLEAAICGVYTHGLAGDIARMSQSEASLIASDIVDALGESIEQSFKPKT